MDLFTTPQEDIIYNIQNKYKFEQGNEEVLLWAALNGKNDILHALITTNKNDPDNFPLQINKYWNLALRYAAQKNNVETINILLEAEADKPIYTDNIKVGKIYNKKKGIYVDKIINYTAKIASGCVRHHDRYYYLFLDWVYDNCTTSIFNLLRDHIEKKNPSFTYTKRARDPITREFLPRWDTQDETE